MTQVKTRNVFIGMPGYGRQTATAGRGLWRACRDMGSARVEYRQGSLLAANFNALWCGALNHVREGNPLDYFAMLHDDIGPEDCWLDKLIDELEERDLDVLGVAVPIKDRKGLSSLAIDAGGTWRPKCRLTMHEIMGLPETFTSDDVGGNLLLNTGCWVCRFDPAWARKVHFTINDRIVIDAKTGRYMPEVEPEDWFFSRLCHEIGLKLGATRKVQVTHRGEYEYDNASAWGNPFDSEYVTRSTLPDAFPGEISGWLRPEEGRALAKLARGKRVLEIGSYCGKSTICMARTAQHITALDYFDGRATPFPRSTADDFRANIERYEVADRIETCHPEAEIPLPKYDFAFIDGAHDRESVEADIEKVLGVLKPDGLIAFHDYRTHPGEIDGNWDEGVTAAVDEFIRNGAELIERNQTVAVVRPPVFVTA